MRPNNRQKLITFQELARRLVREKVRAPADVVVRETVRGALLAEALDRVRPEQVRHEPVRRRLAEAVQLCVGNIVIIIVIGNIICCWRRWW